MVVPKRDTPEWFAWRKKISETQKRKRAVLVDSLSECRLDRKDLTDKEITGIMELEEQEQKARVEANDQKEAEAEANFHAWKEREQEERRK